MPFFIARMSPSGRVVTVGLVAYETQDEAESRARPRQVGEEVWVVEAEHSQRAALRASRMIDDWKQENAARSIGLRQPPQTR
jgi:hypothetical protein